MPWKLISRTVAAEAITSPLAVAIRYLRPDGSGKRPNRDAVLKDRETKLAPVSTIIGTDWPMMRTSAKYWPRELGRRTASRNPDPSGAAASGCDAASGGDGAAAGTR